MTLLVESDAPLEEAAVAASVQAVTKLRGRLDRVAKGILPEDGKVIEDRRSLA